MMLGRGGGGRGGGAAKRGGGVKIVILAEAHGLSSGHVDELGQMDLSTMMKVHFKK